MRPVFCTHQDDVTGVNTLVVMHSYGYDIRVLENGMQPDISDVAVFGTGSPLRNRYMRSAPHRFEQEGIAIPSWAKSTPFVVAVQNERASPHDPRFQHAARTIAIHYASWGPWMRNPIAPWQPVWHRGSVHERFGEWQSYAEEAVARFTVIDRLNHRMSPVFPVDRSMPIDSLVFAGCALFNKPHTDVADAIPEKTRERVVRHLAHALHEARVASASFIVPSSDLIQGDLRDHFHPFMFMSLDEVRSHSREYVSVRSRIFGAAHAHARTDTEVAQALEYSARMLQKDIVLPVAEQAGQEVAGVRWVDLVGRHIDHATRILRRNEDVVVRIYGERVKTRPSYATLHAIDPSRGKRRAFANAILYVAEALFLRDNPSTGVVNCEFADTFWKGLEPVLEREVWGSWRPYIGMVPRNIRQPWAY